MSYRNKNLISENVGIRDVIEKYMFLPEQDDENPRAYCPFHNLTSTPTQTFQIDDRRQQYHCEESTCNARGDMFKFVRELLSVTDHESIQIIAREHKIQLNLSPQEKEKQLLYNALEKANKLYRDFLTEDYNHGGKYSEYLKSRGITRNSILKFQIGAAPNEWNFIYDRLRNEFEEEVLSNAGLIIIRDDESYYDRFRNRIMFPWIDVTDNVIGFTGRAIENAEKTSKYINSPETPVFQKRKTLYSLGNALPHLKKEGRIIIAEGQFDAILAHQNGTKNMVIPAGTNFTLEHAYELNRRLKGITTLFCFDGDEAGNSSAKKIAKELLGKINGHVCILPPKKDPADLFLENGSGALNQYLEKSNSFFEIFFEESIRGIDFQTLEGRISHTKRIVTALREVPFAERINYINFIEGNLSIPRGTLSSAIDDSLGQPKFRSTGYWETRLIQELVSIMPDEPTLKHFSDLKLEESIHGPEAKAAFRYLVRKGNQFQTGQDMPLFRETSVNQVVTEITSSNEEYLLDRNILMRMFDITSSNLHKMGRNGMKLESLERTASKIITSHLHRLAVTAYDGRRTSLEGLIGMRAKLKELVKDIEPDKHQEKENRGEL
ncbi:DNA primase [Candidatus Pacearchaeota archaeon CG10_big_fil_rev_8_21_14_0_10_31_24]|nr:MAG: DNA primase [Candidatus Pacearchaeota archaeon CG10_big_fil_rev_8_21_14_0_10_31_24]